MMGGHPYVGADLRGCVPYPDNLDISSYKKLSLPLLPVKYKTGILVAGDQICKSSESGNHLDLFF